MVNGADTVDGNDHDGTARVGGQRAGTQVGQAGRQGQAGKRVVTYLDTGGGAWGVGAASSVSVPISAGQGKEKGR